MSGLITRVFELIFIVGAPVLILYIVIPAFKKWLGEDKLNLFKQIAQEAVAMAEQLGGDLSSEQKFEAAFNYARKLADWRGVDVDDNLLSGAIEAAVYWLNRGN